MLPSRSCPRAGRTPARESSQSRSPPSSWASARSATTGTSRRGLLAALRPRCLPRRRLPLLRTVEPGGCPACPDGIASPHRGAGGARTRLLSPLRRPRRLGVVLRRAGIRLAVHRTSEPAPINPVRGVPSTASRVGSKRGRAASFLRQHEDPRQRPNPRPEPTRVPAERVHVIADQVGPNEIEVSLLGSMNTAKRRLELDLMLQLWRAAHEQAETRILD